MGGMGEGEGGIAFNSGINGADEGPYKRAFGHSNFNIIKK